MLFLVGTSKLIRKNITVFLENHNFYKYYAVVTVLGIISLLKWIGNLDQ